MMPCDYSIYPENWKAIRKTILDRAKNKCELCGVENHLTGYRDKQGDFHESEGMQIDSDIEDGERVFTIVLTVAHLNHDVNDNRPVNLKALCQRCHLQHDKDRHRSTRWKNKYKNTAELGI